jgi:hypothetical protein
MNAISILTQATKAAFQATLDQPAGVQRYSQFPVHAQEFWKALFDLARDPEKAQQVLDELNHIEDEPCIENDRVWRNVLAVRSTAKMTLLA